MKHVIRAGAVVVVGMVAVLSLAGCIDNPPTPTNSPTTPATTSTPTSSPTPTATPTPVTLACTTILTAQQVYNYNPNFVADNDYQPVAASDAATALADSGVACGWVDETSGSVLSVAIARPTAADLASLKASASGSTSPVAVAPGATGYFSSSGGIGELQVFSGAYWVVISSSDFSAAGDVQPTAAVVIGNIPSH